MCLYYNVKQEISDLLYLFLQIIKHRCRHYNVKQKVSDSTVCLNHQYD